MCITCAVLSVEGDTYRDIGLRELMDWTVNRQYGNFDLNYCHQGKALIDLVRSIVSSASCCVTGFPAKSLANWQVDDLPTIRQLASISFVDE